MVEKWVLYLLYQAGMFSLVTLDPGNLIGGVAALLFLVMRWHANVWIRGVKYACNACSRRWSDQLDL